MRRQRRRLQIRRPAEPSYDLRQKNTAWKAVLRGEDGSAGASPSRAGAGLSLFFGEDDLAFPFFARRGAVKLAHGAVKGDELIGAEFGFELFDCGGARVQIAGLVGLDHFRGKRDPVFLGVGGGGSGGDGFIGHDVRFFADDLEAPYGPKQVSTVEKIDSGLSQQIAGAGGFVGGFEAGGEVYVVADDGVVGAVLAADVA